MQRTTTALEKLKAENASSKVKHIKWEEELSEKLRDYREKRKQWQSEMVRAKEQVAEFETILKVQDGQLEEARKRYRGGEKFCVYLAHCADQIFYRVFDLESELKFLRPTIITIQEYETKVDQLTKQMTLWEQDTATIQEQKQYIEKMLSRWRATENILESYRESEKLAKAELW